MDNARTQKTQFCEGGHMCYMPLTPKPDANIQTPVCFGSRTDALLASFVLKKPEVPLHVVDELLELLRYPDFDPTTLSFASTEDVLYHVSQCRRYPLLMRPILHDSAIAQGQEGFVERSRPSRAALTEDVLDMIASHLFHQRRSFAESARSQEDAATASQGRFSRLVPCPRIRDLMNMSLVGRAWDCSVRRFLQRSVKVIGSAGLRSALLNPRISTSLRELHVVLPSVGVSLPERESDDLREVLFLLRALLKRVPDLEAFYLQTSSAAFQDYSEKTVSAGLAEVFALLPSMQSLRCLWITHIPGPLLHAGNVDAACHHLQTLYSVLPRLRALENLWVHNWCESRIGSRRTMVPITESSSLKSLSFRLGGNAMSFVGTHVFDSGPLSPLFRFAQSIKCLHVSASNLFAHSSRTPFALFSELTPPPERLTSLYLSIDCTPENFDIVLLSARLLVPATQLSNLVLIFTTPMSRLPGLSLPSTIRTLHVHIARPAMKKSILCTQRKLLASEQIWCDLDEDLSSILNHSTHVTEVSSGVGPAPLEKVIVTLEPTSSMRNEAERGFLERPCWRIEGLPLVPWVMRVCSEKKIPLECHRAELPELPDF